MQDLITALKISLIGISVVFVALVVIGGFIHLLSRMEPEPLVPEPPSVPPPSETPDADLLAVISAAVTTTLGPRVRIRRIRQGVVAEDGTWSRQGRIIIMASHRTRN